MTDTRKHIWYFGLEPLMERYTYQLSEQWMPATFPEDEFNFQHVRGKSVDNKIKVGAVLDAAGRGTYSMSQCSEFLRLISVGAVKSGDVVLLQDFWTPGFEAVLYACDLYGIKLKIYSMLHAQSVDEYDFTHKMRHWMRHFELGLDSVHTGIFVGSSVHKAQLREAGFNAPIHVVSLPIHKKLAQGVLKNWATYEKKNQVVFTSRFDKEKNPYFMLRVAEAFLEKHKNHHWIVTTSGEEFRSSDPDFVNDLHEFAKKNDRFILRKKLTKEEYYEILAESEIQFNSSLQDYVSWTLIESTMFNCDICYPNFRSFPEILDEDRMYKPFNVESAVMVLESCLNNTRTHQHISDISDMGRRLEAHIIKNDVDVEYNIWHEHHKFIF